MPNIFNRIIKISIYLLVFLLPLFFLPFSFEAFEFNKQHLLFFLVSLAFLAWLVKMVICDKEIRFKRTPLDLPILAFLFLAILSAIFSVDKSSSLFGFYGRFSDGLIGLLSLGVMYFLITNNVFLSEKPPINADKKISTNQLKSAPISVSGLIKTLMWSVSFVVLMSYFSIFGIWAKLNSLISLPQVMLQRSFNPVSGSMEGLAIFLVVAMVFLVGRILIQKSKIKNQNENSKFKIIFSWLLLFGILGLLVIVDFAAAWVAMLATLVLFLVFALGKRLFRERVNRLLLPIFLIIIAAVFLASDLTKNVLPLETLPKEQVLGQGTSWGIATQAATDNIKNGFLGTGLGSFHYDFAKFKPVEFNQNWLWQIRFDRGGSHLAEILSTMGFLGLLAYFVLVVVFLLIFWFLLQTKGAKSEISQSSASNLKQLPLMLVFLALLVSQFVYYQNTTLAFIFWLVLGLSVVSWQKPIKEKVFSFKDFPELSLVFTSLLIIIGLAMVGSYYFLGKFYLADIKYAQVQRMGFGQNQTKLIEEVVNSNPRVTQYRIILARIYLQEALNEMIKPQTQQDAVKIQTRVAQAIDQAKISAEISPNNVASFETLGMIYRDIRQVATGAIEWGITSFEKAIALEPTNPVLYTELGKLYLITTETPQAKKNFEKALELKSDYIDARIQTALLLEREGNLEEAVAKMENLALSFPFNAEVLFQLGRLYYNNNQLTAAITHFKNVITLVPNHSNALYSLGIAYQAQGKTTEAIAQFEKVLELNPNNPDVIEKLEELRE